MHALLALPFLAALAAAEVREHPGGAEIPHDRYVNVVPEAESPVERLYIPTRDHLYVAAALRKPKGDGPFPVLIHFHGAPGGRGMEKLVTWSRGDTGGPVWERFLREGFVVVVADYRRLIDQDLGMPTPAGPVSYIDDGLAIVEHVRKLPYVDPDRINVYGVSLGGNLALHLIGRTKIHAAILGAPAPMGFLGARIPREPGQPIAVDRDLARRNIEPIGCPVLILAGTADRLLEIDRVLHDLMVEAGKPVRLEVYTGGYHDFVMGPQGHPGRAEPLLEGTLDALERSIRFARGEQP